MMTQKTLSIERSREQEGAKPQQLSKQPPKQYYGLYPKAPPVMVYLFLIGSALFVGLWLLLTISLSTVNLSWACLAMFGAVVLGWIFRKVEMGVDTNRQPFRDHDPKRRKCQNRMTDLKRCGSGTSGVSDSNTKSLND